MAIPSRSTVLNRFDIEASEPTSEEPVEQPAYKPKTGIPSRSSVLSRYGIKTSSTSERVSKGVHPETGEPIEEKPNRFLRALSFLDFSDIPAGVQQEIQDTGARAQRGEASAMDAFLPKVIATGVARGLASKFGGEKVATQEETFEKVIGKPLLEATIGKGPTEVVSSVFGLGADILLDPMTWTPAGAVGKGGVNLLRRFKGVDKAITKAGDVVKGTSVYQGLGRTFVSGFGVPKEFHDAFKSTVRRFGVEQEKVIASTTEQFRGLGKQDVDDITEILDRGIDAAKQGAEQSGRKLSAPAIQLSGELKAGLDGIYDDLVERGLATAEDRKLFYFPHQFEKYLKKDEKMWGEFKPLKRGAPGFLKRRSGIEGWSKNAPAVLARYRTQAQQTMMMDDLITETVKKFGVKVDEITEPFDQFVNDAGENIFSIGGKQYKEVSKNIGGENLLLETSVADEFNKFVRGDQGSKLWKHYDSVHAKWKGLATAGIVIPNPGYTSRNILGNFWNNYLGGVINPMSYLKAGKDQVLRKDTYAKMKDLGWIDNTQTYKDTESVLKSRLDSSGFRRVVSFAFDLPRKGNNFIENNAKLAHVINKIDGGATLDDAIDSANKYLFDYTDLTDWEKKWGKRVIPFYTFMRKNVPLQVNEFLKRPGKFTPAEKLKTEAESFSEEEFLADTERPEWMRDDYFIQLPLRGKDSSGRDAPLFYNPYMPFQDPAAFLENPAQELVERVTPFGKAVGELAFNRLLFDDSEITDWKSLEKNEVAADYTEYLWNAFGPRAAKDLARNFDSIKDEEKDGFVSLMKWLGFYVYPLSEERAMEIQKYNEQGFKFSPTGVKGFESREARREKTLPGKAIKKLFKTSEEKEDLR